jgi:Zn-finger nucleic acid-binding protein
MICPKCNGEMIGVSKDDIFIDTCMDCGAVWLDRETVEKLLAHITQEEYSADKGTLQFESVQAGYSMSYPRKTNSHFGGHSKDYDNDDSNQPEKRSIWDIFN